MKRRYARLAAVAGSMLLCLGLSAFGQEEVSVTLTGGYNGLFPITSGPDAGLYAETGIYSATINKNASPGIICDDFNDNVTNGETWNATAIQASSLASPTNPTLGDTLFGSTIKIQGYAEVATLVSLMFSNGNSLGGYANITSAEISSAIWYITTPGGITGLDSNAAGLVKYVIGLFGGSGATPAQINAATAYLASLTNLWILTPYPLGYAPPGETTEPQEMWTISAPEGGAALMYLMLAGGTCFGAMFLNSRRKSPGSVTA